MTNDRYIKAVLTVIAAALVALVAQNTTQPAIAQLPNTMCPMNSPCYVINTGASPLYVTESGRAAPATERFRGIPPNSGQPK